MFGHSEILRSGVAAWAHSTLSGPSGNVGVALLRMPSCLIAVFGLRTFRRSVGMKNVEVETCVVITVRVYHILVMNNAGSTTTNRPKFICGIVWFIVCWRVLENA